MIAIPVIVIAVIVAALLFIMIVVGASRQTGAAAYSAMSAEGIDWNAIADEELQSYLPDNKINAIKRYRELTGMGLKEAKDAVEYAIAHPDDAKKGRALMGTDTGGAGVRDLIADGKIDEAIRVYAAFMGVDEFTAKDAIAQLQEELNAENRLSDDGGMDEVQELVARGNKLEAIKRYREITGVGLKEAKDAVEGM
jgi:ribosomal protein L7/L12